MRLIPLERSHPGQKRAATDEGETVIDAWSGVAGVDREPINQSRQGIDLERFHIDLMPGSHRYGTLPVRCDSPVPSICASRVPV